ncbi:ABC transporter substrate-binding protein [Bradyrhizobium sp. 195]|uniref:ABC transporter substrate-binding protein n=1 Tax=Bradyrhizobium sp. 195 TaxID=2782662 RepID=UPI002000B077|nr:ABC transporter substrate-binding protein [Bradyrhizobium sp. 195]UPK31146.1 ABC transporter substrate-binding protein [Bradyrhizobium sp. 195]
MALAGAAVCPIAAIAQQPKQVARIGFIVTRSIDSLEARATLGAFRQGLREHGYIDGQNVLVEVRAADSKIERFPALASELVGLNVDVIVASNSVAGRATQRATSTIPIVVPIMGDAVGDGLVASLAKPGGNITGLTFIGPQLVPKRLALLKEALPKASEVVALWQPAAFSEHTMTKMMKEAEAAAQTLGLHLQPVAVPGPDDLEQAFSTIAKNRTDALFVLPSTMLFAERRRIIDLAANLQLPVISMSKEFVEVGGLMSYGADITDFVRRSASYVDKILKGAKPADLPVEQPTKYELVLNLKTAKALDIDISATLLARADEVIE